VIVTVTDENTPSPTPSRATAGAQLERWQDAFNTREIERIVALYAPDAKLFGTAKAPLYVGLEQIRTYFSGASTVTFGPWTFDPLSDTAILAVGDYVFSRPRDGRIEQVPARFSFVFVRRGGEWLILHHHSSAQPK
jgi:hypothetical protein